MASGFFTLLDDIAALMDDVALASKLAAKNTVGILGDDLAVNAEKASGFSASREIPVLIAITKGSLLNKIIILPVAFLLSAFLPWAITIVLIIGGIYLAYEGAEKIYEFIFPHKNHKNKVQNSTFSKEELALQENTKIRSAIVTDFILSIEIVIIALGSVIDQPIINQIIIVSIISIAATIGVYGIVAIIVRMDDFGYKLIKTDNGKSGVLSSIGNLLVKSLPKVIKALNIIGTIALLLVSGGIFVHNIEIGHNFMHFIPSILLEFLTGLFIGFVAFAVHKLSMKLIKKARLYYNK